MTETAPSSTANRANSSGADSNTKSDLVSALAGLQAGRDRAVGDQARRVIRASFGVMQGQKEGRKRSRSVALASFMVLLLALGPFIWRVADDINGGEHLSDIATQTSLWVCILCPAILAAALIAGWSRK